MDNREYDRLISEMRRSYDLAGEHYFQLFHDDILEHEYDQQLLLSFVGSLRNKPVICDMGCGPAGQYGGFVIDKCEAVYGLDISPNNLVLAQQKFPSLAGRCEDMLNTAFPDGELDGIISFYALFHIPKEKTDELFLEFHRILKPGGRALIVTHKGDMDETLTRIWGRDDLSILANFHREAELAGPASAAGFIVDRIYSKETYYPFPEERIILIMTKPMEESWK